MSRVIPLTPGDMPATRESDSGDSAGSVAEIFSEHGAYVWRALRHLGIREADLPDITQEVFIVVHRRLADFEGRSALRTWLYGICLRTASDYRRRAHVRREIPVAEVPEGVAEAPQGAQVERTQLRARLQRLLQELDVDKKEIFVLYEIEELSMKQVAKIVGVPLQTAYSRLHAARRVLAERLAEEEQ